MKEWIRRQYQIHKIFACLISANKNSVYPVLYFHCLFPFRQSFNRKLVTAYLFSSLLLFTATNFLLLIHQVLFFWEKHASEYCFLYGVSVFRKNGIKIQVLPPSMFREIGRFPRAFKKFYRFFGNSLTHPLLLFLWKAKCLVNNQTRIILLERSFCFSKTIKSVLIIENY